MMCSMVIKSFTSFSDNYELYNSLIDSQNRDQDYLLIYSQADKEKSKFFDMQENGDVLEVTSETTNAPVPVYGECYFYKDEIPFDIESFLLKLKEISDELFPDNSFIFNDYKENYPSEHISITDTINGEETEILSIVINWEKRVLNLTIKQNTEFSEDLASNTSEYIQSTFKV